MTAQLTVPSLALRPLEAPSSAPVTREAANSQNTWPTGRRLSRKGLRDPKSRFAGHASRTHVFPPGPSLCHWHF